MEVSLSINSLMNCSAPYSHSSRRSCAVLACRPPQSSLGVWSCWQLQGAAAQPGASEEGQTIRHLNQWMSSEVGAGCYSASKNHSHHTTLSDSVALFVIIMEEWQKEMYCWKKTIKNLCLPFARTHLRDKIGRCVHTLGLWPPQEYVWCPWNCNDWIEMRTTLLRFIFAKKLEKHHVPFSPQVWATLYWLRCCEEPTSGPNRDSVLHYDQLWRTLPSFK